MTAPARSNPAPRSSCRTTIELVVHWDDSVLLVQHMPVPGVFWLSERVGAYPGHEFVVPEGTLELAQAPLVIAHGEHDVRLVVPPNARSTVRLPDGRTIEVDTAGESAPSSTAHLVKLERGFEARLQLGRLSFVVRVTHPAERIGRAPWSAKLLRVGALAAVSVGLHLGVGACTFYNAAPARDDGELTEQQRYLVQHYLDGAEERALEERESEQLAAREDPHEGGTGSRAKGEQGSLGNPNREPTANRYGAQGPADAPDAHLARQAALRDSADFGMIGLLNSGAGGNPDAPSAPWGRDDALGTAPWQARGSAATTGGGSSAAGHGLGASGLAMSGIGSGRGAPGGHSPSGWRTPGTPAIAAPIGAPWPALEQPQPPPRAIDPNGRFATTYRPGRGHLAAFDAAMARGTISPATRELVSDVGADYAPTLPLPTDRALGYAVSLERTALPPDGGAVHLRVALRSAEAAIRARPRLSVHVALDTSGSMSGEPLERAKEAASHLVAALAPADEFSLTTFAQDAHVIVASGPVGSRRAAIRRAIDETSSGGSTNIGDALEHTYAQAARRAASGDVVPVVMLLSDGQPTAGIRNRAELAFIALQAFQQGIQTSTFGLGTSFDGELMSKIASDGAGGYYYLQHADQITTAFRAELRQRLDPAATAVEVRIRLDRDVSLLNVYGSRRLDERESAIERAKEIAADTQAEHRAGIGRDRQQDAPGGMRFFIPAFGRQDTYSLLLEVNVPPGRASRAIGTFELRYKDRVHGTNVGEESPIRVSFAADAAASAATADRSVARTIQGHAAGEALLTASHCLGTGRVGDAIALLRERQQILEQAARSLEEPAFERDAGRFSRLLALLQDDETRHEPLALAIVLETAGRSHLR